MVLRFFAVGGGSTFGSLRLRGSFSFGALIIFEATCFVDGRIHPSACSLTSFARKAACFEESTNPIWVNNSRTSDCSWLLILTFNRTPSNTVLRIASTRCPMPSNLAHSHISTTRIVPISICSPSAPLRAGIRTLLSPTFSHCTLQFPALFSCQTGR